MKIALMTILLFFSSIAMAQPALYTSSGERYEVDDVEGAMAEIFSGSSRTRYVNIFVHGRGKHPEKGLAMLPELEDTHNVKSIMFHWPSWKSALERPVDKAIDSADELNTFLKAFNTYVRRHPIKMFGVKVSLLVHSMGNIVFKSMLEDHYQGDFKWNLFSTITLNAADVPMKDHAEWVERIDFGKSTYITYNDDDIVLYGSEKLDLFNDDFEMLEGKRLGRNLGKYIKRSEIEKAENAIYLDFSRLTFGGHRHFLVKEKRKNHNLIDTFSHLLKGKKPRLDRRGGVYKILQNIFFFKR